MIKSRRPSYYPDSAPPPGRRDRLRAISVVVPSGCIIAYIAVQTGSLWPGMVYHLVHNTLVYLAGITNFDIQKTSLRRLQWQLPDGSFMYRPEVILASVVFALVLLVWFSRFPYRRTQEETLQESIEQDADAVHSLVG